MKKINTTVDDYYNEKTYYRLGFKEEKMRKLITTPHNFIWRVKNPQDYWSDSFKEAKCIVYLNKKKLGKFCGINRTFDDDMYYLNYFKENGELNYCSVYKDAEIILEPIV